MLYQNDWSSADQIPQRAIEQGALTPFGSVDDTLGGESHRYSLSARMQQKLSASSLLDVTLYALDYQMDLWSNFTYFTDPQGDQFQQADARQVFGGDARYSIADSSELARWAHQFGVLWRYDDIDTLGLYRTSQRRYVSTVREDAVKEGSVGVFWQGTRRWSDKLRSVTSARYDHYQFDVNPIAAENPESLAVNGGKVSEGIATGGFNLVYQINGAIEGYASVGRGFHSNDARGVTLQQSPLAGESEALAPADPLVATQGGEVGMRLFTDEVLHLSAALWFLDVDSELLFVGDEGTTEDTGVGSRRHGLEVAGTYYLNDAVTLGVSYATTSARFDEAVDGSIDIPGAIDQVASIDVDHKWNHKLRTHWHLRYIGEYPLAEHVEAEASLRLDWRARWQLNDAIALHIDVLNVLDADDNDVQYYYESQLANENAPVFDIHRHVLAPRSARFTIKYLY